MNLGARLKPIKLTMKAFGPYSGVTEVNFEKFGKWPVLISGDTGAGKTTIFDAISMLYSIRLVENLGE